jgi:hypothetical protein
MGPTKPQVSETSPSPLAQHSHLASQEIPDQGGVAAVGQSTTQSLSRAISAAARRLRSPLAGWRCHKAREGPRAAENGEVESLPHPLCLHPPLHHPFSRIWGQREFPPPTTLPPLRRWFSPVSFASVPTTICCRHSWPPISPLPQVR